MSFDHDSFIGLAQYGQLDTRLQWYIDTVGPKWQTLERLAKEHPDQAKILFSRDPVLRKLVLIADNLNRIINEVRGSA